MLEALQKISDAPLKDCRVCGKPELKKKVSAAAFRLKGGGWYETDFKTGNKKNLAGSPESGSTSGADSGGSANKTDGASKPGNSSGDSSKSA